MAPAEPGKSPGKRPPLGGRWLRFLSWRWVNLGCAAVWWFYWVEGMARAIVRGDRGALFAALLAPEAFLWVLCVWVGLRLWRPTATPEDDPPAG